MRSHRGGSITCGPQCGPVTVKWIQDEAANNGRRVLSSAYKARLVTYKASAFILSSARLLPTGGESAQFVDVFEVAPVSLGRWTVALGVGRVSGS